MTLEELLDKDNPGWRSEECDCGHFRVVHAMASLALGHGACEIGGCPCAKFTWRATHPRPIVGYRHVGPLR